MFGIIDDRLGARFLRLHSKLATHEREPPLSCSVLEGQVG